MYNISDSLLQKADVISSLNSKSPALFYSAVNNFEKKLYSAAVHQLEDYLRNYPNDIAAVIYLCKTYARIGKFQLAIDQLKNIKGKIPSEQVYEYYLSEIKSSGSSAIEFVKLEHSDDIHYTNEDKASSADIKKPDTYENLLVSETLAKIYISQGELKEALNIYEKLAAMKPGNKTKYLEVIADLKTRLSS